VNDEVKKMNIFERYLTVWVAVCMIAGVVLGKLFPGLTAALSAMEFTEGSHVNIPIVVLIWLMIFPMMLKIDFSSILQVGKNPKGLFITLFVNWMVKPFSMFLLGLLFFKVIFSQWISPEQADQFMAGVIILAAAPCTAMVFVWSYLTDGDPAYTLVQVAVNDLLMLVLFVPRCTASCRRLFYSSIHYCKSWNRLVREPLRGIFSANYHYCAAYYPGYHLRFPGRKYHRKGIFCCFNCYSNTDPGLL